MIKKNVTMSFVVALFIACAQDSFCGDFQPHNLVLSGIEKTSQQDVDILSQKLDQIQATVAQLNPSVLKSCLRWVGNHAVNVCMTVGVVYVVARYGFGFANQHDVQKARSEVNAVRAENHEALNSRTKNMLDVLKGKRSKYAQQLYDQEEKFLNNCDEQVKAKLLNVREGLQRAQNEAVIVQSQLADLSKSDQECAQTLLKKYFVNHKELLDTFQESAIAYIKQQRNDLESLLGAAQNNNSHMNQWCERIESPQLPQQSSPFPALTYKQ